jgi:hypothetical protein
MNDVFSAGLGFSPKRALAALAGHLWTVAPAALHGILGARQQSANPFPRWFKTMPWAPFGSLAFSMNQRAQIHWY